MKNSTKISLCVIALLFCIWGIAVAKNKYLTFKYSAEFQNFSQMDYDYLHPWEGEPNIRVLRYCSDRAVIYFYDENGGEKVAFTKHNGQWKFTEQLAIWSSMGSADDRFIWPYYKNFVP